MEIKGVNYGVHYNSLCNQVSEYYILKECLNTQYIQSNTTPYEQIAKRIERRNHQL